MTKYVLSLTAIALLLATAPAALNAAAPEIATLTARGAKIKTDKDGSAIEIYFPPALEMTL